MIEKIACIHRHICECYCVGREWRPISESCSGFHENGKTTGKFICSTTTKYRRDVVASAESNIVNIELPEDLFVL